MNRCGKNALRLLVAGLLSLAARPNVQAGMPKMMADRLAAEVASAAALKVMTSDVSQSLRMATRLDLGNRTLQANTERLKLKAENKRAAVDAKIDSAQAKRVERLLTQATRWNDLQECPQLNRSRIVTGEGLNFLLDRFDAEVLASGSEWEQDPAMAKTLNALTLTPDLIHRLTLREVNTNGEVLTFRADGHASAITGSLPFLVVARIRESPELKAAVDEYDVARDALYVDEGDRVEKIVRISAAIDALATAYDTHCSPEAQGKPDDPRLLLEFIRGRKSLLVHRGFVNRLRSLQSLPDQSVRYVPARDGAHLVGLMTHMTRNGLTFAPAQPGDEPAYLQVFRMMRDLYKATEPQVDLPTFSQPAPQSSR